MTWALLSEMEMNLTEHDDRNLFQYLSSSFICSRDSVQWKHKEKVFKTTLRNDRRCGSSSNCPQLWLRIWIVKFHKFGDSILSADDRFLNQECPVWSWLTLQILTLLVFIASLWDEAHMKPPNRATTVRIQPVWAHMLFQCLWPKRCEALSTCVEHATLAQVQQVRQGGEAGCSSWEGLPFIRQRGYLWGRALTLWSLDQLWLEMQHLTSFGAKASGKSGVVNVCVNTCRLFSRLFFLQRRSSVQMAFCSQTLHPQTRSAFSLSTRWTPAWPTRCRLASTPTTTCWPAASARWPSRWVTSSSSSSTRRSSARRRCCPTAAMTRWMTEEEEVACRAFITTPSGGS